MTARTIETILGFLTILAALVLLRWLFIIYV